MDTGNGFYILVTTAGTVHVENWVPPDEQHDLLRATIGGYLECVSLTAEGGWGPCVWLDEEGRLKQLPVNALSAPLARISNAGDFFVGDIIVTGGADDEGDTIGLSSVEVDFWIGEIGLEKN